MWGRREVSTVLSVHYRTLRTKATISLSLTLDVANERPLCSTYGCIYKDALHASRCVLLAGLCAEFNSFGLFSTKEQSNRNPKHVRLMMQRKLDISYIYSLESYDIQEFTVAT